MKTRRDFLRLTGAAALAAVLAPYRSAAAAMAGSLKITAVDVWPLRTGSIFVRVQTDGGISGLGECSPMNQHVIVSMLREALVPRVIGRNPLDIVRIWEDLLHGTYKLGTSGCQPEAMAGIDLALWDLLGQATQLPVWQLLGGRRREKVRLYSSIGGGARAEVATQVRHAAACVEQGFTALKLRMDWSSRQSDVNPAKDLDLLRAVRREVGDVIELLYDANNGLSVPTAIRLGKQMHEELHVIHFEEPLAQHDYAGYAEVAAALEVPVAAGEHEYTRWQFRDLIAQGRVDIVQPDLVKCAGLSEGVQIAHLAQTHNKLLVPHQTQPTIGHVANLHFTSVFENAGRAQEYNYAPENARTLWDLFEESFAPEQGYSRVPEGPGWGLRLKEKALQKVLVDG